jgi:transcriptional regulator with XRE-family HTH domain
MLIEKSVDLGEAIRRQRVTIPLTLQELATMSGVSPSHLGRIERGERYPSARVLRRIAKPLGLDEDELFTLAGYLSPPPPGVAEAVPGYSGKNKVDPYVADVLAREPPEVQRALIAILTILKNIARGMGKE